MKHLAAWFYVPLYEANQLNTTWEHRVCPNVQLPTVFKGFTLSLHVVCDMNLKIVGRNFIFVHIGQLHQLIYKKPEHKRSPSDF
jgi:hypothetical protein